MVNDDKEKNVAKLLATLAEHVISHSKALDGAGILIMKHATIMKDLLPQCVACGDEPATLQDDRFKNVGFCDHCAASEVREGLRSMDDLVEVENVELIRELDVQASKLGKYSGRLH